MIRELREQGKTIVLSGHLLADMQDICDRIAILHRGELKEIGRVSDLLTVQDVTQIKARNLGPAAIEEIRDVIHRCGGGDVTIDHPTTTLEELFLRIVQESDLHPGRRKVAHDMGRPAGTPEGRTGGNTVETPSRGPHTGSADQIRRARTKNSSDRRVRAGHESRRSTAAATSLVKLPGRVRFNMPEFEIYRRVRRGYRSLFWQHHPARRRTHQETEFLRLTRSTATDVRLL